MIRRHATGFRALLMAFDATLAATLFVGLSAWRFPGDWDTWWRTITSMPEVFPSLYAIGWVVALTASGLYRPRARWSILREALDVIGATLTMAVITFSLLFLFKLPDVSRLFLLALFPAQAAVTTMTRVLLRLAFEHIRELGYNVRHILVLGAGVRGQAFARKLEAHRELGLRIDGFLDDNPDVELPGKWQTLGGLDDLERVLHERIVDEVAICLPFAQWNLIDSITRLCEEEGKIVRIPMDVLDRAVAVGRLEDLDGTPVFSIVSGPDRALALLVKRLFDVVAALIASILLSPVLVGVALAIRLREGGPVLFRQTRVGLHGRQFEVVKFRTMEVGAHDRQAELADHNEISGPAFKVTDDPRITSIGHWLRRTSIDELPQLWNVLRGEMSLVGPRPPLPSEVDGYDLWHRRRLSMKPGITGLWQVRDRRDPDFDRWVASDLEYIDRWSLWLDLKILLRTIPAALEGR
jgi:exopolysaccharide biosynthesis polyprenyl glycosylphosphotransferase